MFATLLRRWRLAAPLALVGMVSILVGALALTPASAHADRPLTFSGSAAAAQAQLSGTVFVTAAFDACDTGSVTKHGNSSVTEAASEPIAFAALLVAAGNAQVTVLAAPGVGQCFTSAKSTRTGDGVGRVTTTSLLNGPIAELTALLSSGTVKLFAIGGDAASSSSAWCKHEGTAHSSSATSVFGGSGIGLGPNATHPFGQYVTAFNPGITAHDITGQANQPIFGLPPDYSGFLNVQSATASGSHASATSAAVEIFGPGFHEVIAASHADIHCPK